MLRRIKRFLGFSARGTYFPNDSVAPSADGSMISTTSSRKSTKSEKKSAKKEKKKSPLVEDSPAFIHLTSPPTEIIIGGEESIACSASETDRQTVITDSLPYRDPSDKVFLDAPPLPSQNPPSSSSTRSLAGSGASIGSRMESVNVDIETAALTTPRDVESVYSTDLAEDTDSQKTCDARSRELPVDCDVPKPVELDSSQSSTTSSSEVSSLCVNLPAMTIQQEELTGEDTAAMQKFNAELDGLLKTSAPPFQVSTARLPPMLSMEHLEEQNSLLEEFDDSKNNSVTRILNESHEATSRSPENKHLKSYGY